MLVIALIIGLLIACTGRDQGTRTEEIVFHSGSFKLVGDLILPGESGPHPVILFVHGDGPNNRTSGVTYPPIMERMHRVGFATFAWDKPGTGASTGRIDRSRLVEQRAQIVLDAIALLKARPDIDAEMIGLWGISQAGYVMPRVLSNGGDVAFMIAVSCPGEAGADQGVFLLTKQAVCAGLPAEDAEEVERLIDGAGRAQTYDEYLRYKAEQANYPVLSQMSHLGFSVEPRPESDWHADDLSGEYFRDPLQEIEGSAIPVLAVFGELDTQADPFQGAEAYRALLERGGNPHSRVELIPGVDHNILLSETGCLTERNRRPRREWTNYALRYLEVLEEWLRELRR